VLHRNIWRKTVNPAHQTISKHITIRVYCCDYPGSKEYYWILHTSTGLLKIEPAGPYDSDDEDVLMQWALDGRGIINKPYFEVARHLDDGSRRGLPVTPPVSIQLAAIISGCKILRFG
jgi:hypothetical protein